MTIKQLATEICRREGKRKQVDIAQMTEILGHLSDFTYENYSRNKLDPTPTATAYVDVVLYNNGKRRAKRGKK